MPPLTNPSKINMKTPKKTASAAEATPEPTPPPAATEERNIAVTILENGLKIGNAICGSGPCSFPLTMADAKTLEALGKVRITGIF